MDLRGNFDVVPMAMWASAPARSSPQHQEDPGRSLFLWAWQPPNGVTGHLLTLTAQGMSRPDLLVKHPAFASKKVILIFHLRSPDLHLTDRMDENPFAVSVH